MFSGFIKKTGLAALFLGVSGAAQAEHADKAECNSKLHFEEIAVLNAQTISPGPEHPFLDKFPGRHALFAKPHPSGLPRLKHVGDMNFAVFAAECDKEEKVVYTRHELSEKLNDNAFAADEMRDEIQKAYDAFSGHLCTLDEREWMDQKALKLPSSTARCPDAF